MRGPRRWPVYLAAGALILLVAMLWIAPRFIDWSGAKPGLEAMIARQVGVKATLRGNLGIELLPQPRITAADVVLDGPVASGRLRWLRGRLDPAALLAGRLVPRDLHIVEADLTLPLATPPAGGAPPPEAEIRIEDSRIRLTGAPDWLPAELSRLDGRIALGGPGRVLGFDGEGRLADAPIGLSLVLQRGGGISLALAHGPSAADLALEGRPADTPGAWTGRATLVLEEAAFLSTLEADAAGQILGAGPATADFAVRVAGDGTLSLTLEQLESARLVGGTGRAVLTPGSQPSLDIAFDLTRIDASGAGLDPVRLAAAGARLLRQAEDIDISLTLQAGSFVHPAGTWRDLRADGAAGGGILALDRLSVVGPGGADVTLSGTLTPPEPEARGGGWRFLGDGSLKTDDLRAIAAWLPPTGSGEALARLPADRLRRADISGDLRAGPEGMTLGPLSGRLDETRFDATLSHSAVGGWALVGTADSLNLDRYDAGAGLAGLPGMLAGWALDAEGRPMRIALALERVILGGLPGSGVTLLADRAEGVAEADLTLDDFAGSGLRASLYRQGLDLRLALRGTVPAPDRLAGALGLPARQAAGLARLGALEASADLSLTPDGTVGYAAALSGAGGSAAANGVIRPGPAGRVTLSDAALDWDGISVFDVAGTCAREPADGAWQCQGLQAGMPGLTLQGEATLTAAGVPEAAPDADPDKLERRLTVRLTDARVDAGAFLARTGLPVTLEGTLTGRGTMMGQGAGLSGALAALSGPIALDGALALRLSPGAGGRLAQLGRVRQGVRDAFGAPAPLSGTLTLAPAALDLTGRLEGDGAAANVTARLSRHGGGLSARLEIREAGRSDPALELEAEGPADAPALTLGGGWLAGR
jgi:hypothetical protein